MSANLHANGGLLRKELKLPDFRSYAVDVAQAGKVLHENTKPLGEFLRDVMRDEHDQLSRVRPGRDRLQPPAVDLRGEQEDLDGRSAARRCGRRGAGARWAGDGDALGAHAAGLARRLPAVRAPRLLPHLRSIRARGGFDVQPARQVARHLQEPRAVARFRVVAEHSAVLDRLAPGSQRLLAPGPGLHRSGDQQEPDGNAHLSPAGREHAARGGRPVPALDRLHQCDRRRQAEASAVHHHRRGHRALRQGHRHLARARATTKARSRTW